MRPIPRLLAITDPAVVAAEDFPIRTGAIAAGGSAVGLVVRAGADPDASRAALARVRALAGPPAAAAIADDPGLAALAHGVQLGIGAAATVAEARRAVGAGWVGVSVRSAEDARRARDDGADWIVAGPIFPTAADPTVPAKGIPWLAEIVATKIPVFAVGGITLESVDAIRSTGIWGLALGAALWRAPDSARATDGFLRAWTGTAA